MNPNNIVKQNILAIQQNKKALPKVKWIRQHTKGLIEIDVIDIKSNIPYLIDDSSQYLPKYIKADLVLDYLDHPDLSNDLVKMCLDTDIPIISSGSKTKLGKEHYIPNVCCALNRYTKLGEYGKHFGKPELTLNIDNNKIVRINILHGSPCGSTWRAANKIIGSSIKDAAIKFGLNIQFFCKANSSKWNPIIGKNPIHVAAEIHKSVMIKAIKHSQRLN